MKRLTPYQLKKISNNLDRAYNNANKFDIDYGLNWYKEVNNICLDIASRYNTTTRIVAGVISALSPRNKWEQNIRDTYKVFDAIEQGLGPNDIKVCTFNNNKAKAFRIALGQETITDKSLKTYNFVNNIAYLSEDHLTIDIWHLRACFDKMIKIDNASIGRIAYEQIKELTIKKAAKQGLKGYQYQAIVWSQLRNRI